MLKLIIGEWQKLNSQKIILLIVGTLLVFNIGFAAFEYLNQESEEVSINWKQELLNQNVELQQNLNEVPKGSLVSGNNQREIILNEYRVEQDLPPSNISNIWTFAYSSKIILSFVGLFIIAVSSQLVSSEFQWKTIKTVLTKPVSKWKFITSKIITLFTLTFFAVGLQFIISLLFGAIVFGFKGEDFFLTVQNGQVIEESSSLFLLRHFFLTAISLFIIGMMALMFSTIFRITAMAMAVSLFLYFTGGNITRLLAQYFEGMKYSLFANTELTLYFNGSKIFNDMTITFSLIILSLYLCFFLMVSIGAFIMRET